MMDQAPIKRGPGRPPKIKPIGTEGFYRVGEPVVTDCGREPTAAEQIAALTERRAFGNGYIITPPEQLTAASFRAWLHSVAELGSPGDVEIAWHRCQNGETKARLENEYVALKNAAGARYHALMQQAERDEHIERAASARRAEKAQMQRQIIKLKAEIARLEEKLARM